MSATKRPKLDVVKSDSIENSVHHDTSSTSGINDWRDCVKERLLYALKKDHLSDITFCVGPEKTKFHGHKLLLSLASHVFEDIFKVSLNEKSADIDLPDVTPQGFKLLLDFIYTDDLKMGNEQDALSAWYVAEKYCLPRMKNSCLEYLSKCISISNVWAILEASQVLNEELLSLRCFDFLDYNLYEAMNTASFLEISSETIEIILQMSNIQIKEDYLLRGIIKWVKEQLKKDAKKSVGELFNPFMGFIRIGCLTQYEFADFIDEHTGLISDSDALAIMKYMANPVRHSLPSWCCKIWKQRGINSNSVREQNRKDFIANVLKPKIQKNIERSILKQASANKKDEHQIDAISSSDA